jgi:hypothetical protein
LLYLFTKPSTHGITLSISHKVEIENTQLKICNGTRCQKWTRALYTRLVNKQTKKQNETSDIDYQYNNNKNNKELTNLIIRKKPLCTSIFNKTNFIHYKIGVIEGSDFKEKPSI